jgi:hypothetical protein
MIDYTGNINYALLRLLKHGKVLCESNPLGTNNNLKENLAPNNRTHNRSGSMQVGRTDLSRRLAALSQFQSSNSYGMVAP